MQELFRSNSAEGLVTVFQVACALTAPEITLGLGPTLSSHDTGNLLERIVQIYTYMQRPLTVSCTIPSRTPLILFPLKTVEG